MQDYKFLCPAVIIRGILTLLFLSFLYVCTVTDFSANRCEILHGGHISRQDFGGIAPGMAEFWGSTGAIWRDMLLAEALVTIYATRVNIQTHNQTDRHHSDQLS